MMTEWVRIYGDPDNRPFQDALWFHERWLPGFLSRCEKWFRCDVSGCLPGEDLAVGAIATALHLTVPKAPACFPCAGAFCVSG